MHSSCLLAIVVSLALAVKPNAVNQAQGEILNPSALITLEGTFHKPAYNYEQSVATANCYKVYHGFDKMKRKGVFGRTDTGSPDTWLHLVLLLPDRTLLTRSFSAGPFTTNNT